MRRVISFILGALFFGFLTEAGRTFYMEDYKFSYVAAIITGLIFSTIVEVTIFLKEKQKNNE